MRYGPLPLSEPLDVQLGRRGSGEQQTMNLKSPILCVSNQHLAKQSFFLVYTLHPSRDREPPDREIENGVAYAPKAKGSFVLAHT
jgi:hypothetical protein